ncbi:MAG: hypothetical protein AABY22_22320 [Nanoarchaeota archaeon]
MAYGLRYTAESDSEYLDLTQLMETFNEKFNLYTSRSSRLIVSKNISPSLQKRIHGRDITDLVSITPERGKILDISPKKQELNGYKFLKDSPDGIFIKIGNQGYYFNFLTTQN